MERGYDATEGDFGQTAGDAESSCYKAALAGCKLARLSTHIKSYIQRCSLTHTDTHRSVANDMNVQGIHTRKRGERLSEKRRERESLSPSLSAPHDICISFRNTYDSTKLPHPLVTCKSSVPIAYTRVYIHRNLHMAVDAVYVYIQNTCWIYTM